MGPGMTSKGEIGGNMAEDINSAKNALNVQVGGNHYRDMVIQPIEFITANNIGYIEGNIIKYICRHAHKDGLQDLEKIKHYVDLLIEAKYKPEMPTWKR